MSREAVHSSFAIPERPAGSMTGSEFAASIKNLPLGPEREREIFHQFEIGNVPDFMRKTRLVTTSGAARGIIMEVLPDVLCVGTDADFMRLPMNPMTAQKIADLYQATLITPHISDLIWQQADVRIDPLLTTMTPGAQMTSTQWFIEQNAKVEHLRAGRQGLIAGHKKDVVVADTLALAQFKDNHVAIYGWHRVTGIPIQGLNPMPGEALTHEITYADYSHGVRLMAMTLFVNDDPVSFLDAAVDPTLGFLLNEGGTLRYLRYPTN